MIFEHIISIIAPYSCLSCSEEGALLCVNCIQTLPGAIPRCFMCQRPSPASTTCRSCRKTTAVAAVRAATPYKGVAKDLLWKLKAERAQSAGQLIGAYCATLVEKEADTLVTYIPTASDRVRQRGYDQAKLIARSVAQCVDMPMVPLLARTSTSRQVGADAQTRRRQLAKAFRPINSHAAVNKNIILIDDVITTGSTIRFAASVLEDLGSAKISAIVFAQA